MIIKNENLWNPNEFKSLHNVWTGKLDSQNDKVQEN